MAESQTKEAIFVAGFETAGFYGTQILKRDADPWRTLRGIEFRSVTIEAFNEKQDTRFDDAATQGKSGCCDAGNCC